MFYLTYGSEVITEQMIAQALKAGKKVVLPAVTGPKRMAALQIQGLGKHIYKSKLGPREPDAKSAPCPGVSADKIDLVVVPGVCFDRTGLRLGYGKGFYDNWLKKFTVKQRVGIAFHCQISEEIPAQAHDERAGVVITEKETIRTIKKKGVKANA